jgi:nitrate/nitrite transport system substrate-binding protein
MAFHQNGDANYPYLSDGMWFMTQHRRWGLLKGDPDYHAVAARIHQTALYAEAADLTGTPVPASPLRSSVLMDGSVWDGQNPARYAASFAVKQ